MEVYRQGRSKGTGVSNMCFAADMEMLSAASTGLVHRQDTRSGSKADGQLEMHQAIADIKLTGMLASNYVVFFFRGYHMTGA